MMRPEYTKQTFDQRFYIHVYFIGKVYPPFFSVKIVPGLLIYELKFQLLSIIYTLTTLHVQVLHFRCEDAIWFRSISCLRCTDNNTDERIDRCVRGNSLVGWLYWGFTLFQRYFSHIATLKQEITNLWNSSGEAGNRTPDLLLRNPRA